MRLEILYDNTILVYQTGSKVNEVEYDSRKDMKKYSRFNLDYVENFLRANGQIKEADKIKKHLGKRLRIQEIPQLIPTGDYKIISQLEYLKDKIQSFIDRDKLDLDPDFQRGHVWKLDQRIKFVEFILQGGKTNPIYFNSPGWMRSWDGEMVIVDGKQRLTSILMFLDNEFPVFKNLDEDGIGFYRKDLNTLGHLDIEIVINNLETREQVLEWYLQMNKGNIAHTEEELSRVESLLTKEKERF